MKTPFKVSRVLLGLIFLASGFGGFLLISNPPPMPPGLAGEFQTVFFRSGWVLFVDSIELLAGLALLTNRFVPLALVSLAAVIANILTFHFTMMPAGLPVAFFVTLLWFTVSWPYRKLFAPIFARRVDAAEIAHAGLRLSHSRS